MLFKGYVQTNNKKPVEKITGRSLKTLGEVKQFSEYAGILNDETILIDIDDFNESEILFKIVQDLNLKCRVYKTTRGKHFLFINKGVDKNRIGCNLAIGIKADIKLGTRNSYEVIKYDGKDREILHDAPEDEIQELPKWMQPVKSNMDFLNLKAGDGRNQALFNYILVLQSNDFTVEEARETIKILNKYVLEDPLSDRELAVILRDDAFSKPVFYKGSTFLHDKFAVFLKNNNYIVKIDNQLHIYRDGIYLYNDSAIKNAMLQYLPNLNRSKRAEVYSYLEDYIIENAEIAPANFIAFANGIYNIIDGELLPFSPEFIIKNKINWNYNPDAYSELADDTLNKLACQDEQIRMLLEELIGYCFYRRNELGKAFILTGYKSNGKSTFLNMIVNLLGENNIAALDLKELGDKFKNAELYGKLANIGDDIGDDFIPNPSIFKKLVTGERVNVERKGQNPFDFNNYSKMLFSANNIPRIKDKTGAVLRRLIIIPFEANFTKDDPDFKPFIKYDLEKPEVMEYLIKIGIDGLYRVLENKEFTTSEKVKKELDEYEASNNPIIGFYKDVGEDFIVNEVVGDIYRSYKIYCDNNNLQALSNIEFSRQMNKRFDLEIVDKKVNGKKCRIFVRREGF